jgi:hypothetical protein
MLDSILNALFGCTHQRTTFPLTPGRTFKANAVAHRHGTYIVCLDCGQEFRYDWADMRIGEAVVTRSYPSAAQSYSTVNQ